MEIVSLALFVLQILINHEKSHFCEAATAGGGDPRYPYQFMTTDAKNATSRSYDYIIVGGGTAGCPLAATLSAKYKVLVLERGGSPYGNPDIEKAANLPNAERKADNYTSVVQKIVSEEGASLIRARVLGGGTSINGGFYSRDSLENIRRMGLNEKLAIKSFEWVERQVVFKPRLSTWNSAVRNAFLEAGLLPDNGYTLDHLEGTKTGASTFDSNGTRYSAANFLRTANPNNIVVLLNATASRLLFNSTAGKLEARGVEFTSSVDGRSYQVLTKPASPRSEVLLTAGALGSPQLLLLSGIGPAEHLKEFDIPVLLDLPSVGKDIRDPAAIRLTIQSPIPLEVANTQAVAMINNSQIYLECASGFQQTPSNTTEYMGGIYGKVAFPLSSGELRLHTKDPRDNPSVRYNYFTQPYDVDTCVESVKTIANLLETSPIQKYAFNFSGLRFVGPPLPNNTSDIPTFCKENYLTFHHFHGGCGSLVDEEYRVKNITRLRIVDGSTFSYGSPGTNPQATVMMLGRYVGEKILQYS